MCINQEWIDEKVKKKIRLKIAVQINGKTKAVIEIDSQISKENVLEIVKKNEKIKKILLGKNILKEIYVPGKIINLVV